MNINHMLGNGPGGGGDDGSNGGGGIVSGKIKNLLLTNQPHN